MKVNIVKNEKNVPTAVFFTTRGSKTVDNLLVFDAESCSFHHHFHKYAFYHFSCTSAQIIAFVLENDEKSNYFLAQGRKILYNISPQVQKIFFSLKCN